MEDSDYCNESRYCPMRLDLENTINKLAFLKENWSVLDDTEKINELPTEELKCAVCMNQIVIDDLTKEKYYCSYRDIIRLVTRQMYIHNTYEIRKLQEELQEKLGKEESNTSQR